MKRELLKDVVCKRCNNPNVYKLTNGDYKCNLPYCNVQWRLNVGEGLFARSVSFVEKGMEGYGDD